MGKLFRVERFGNAGEPPNVEEDGQFLLLALHAVQLGVARHFFGQFGWGVLAEAISQLSFAARFNEVAQDMLKANRARIVERIAASGMASPEFHKE